MTRIGLFALALVPLAIACDKDGEDNTDDTVDSAMPYCEDTASPMAPDDMSSFGLSGQQLLDSIPAQLVGASAFADGAEAGLTVRIVVDAASMRSVASEAVYPETGGPVPDIAVICPARMELDAQVELITEDGRLAETIEAVLSTDDPAEMGGVLGEVYFFADLDHEALSGTLDMADFADLDAYDKVSLSLSASILDHSLLGELGATGSRVDGNTASATFLPVADLDAAGPVE